MPDTLTMLLLLIHGVSTVSMAGLIWTVQVVHYPLFARVGEQAFREYEIEHTRRITRLVGPLMLAEATSAAALPLLLNAPAARLLTGVGLAFLLVAWLSTALLQVPCHARLSRGFDEAILRRLVRTNWIRTAAWSARGVLSLALLTLM